MDIARRNLELGEKTLALVEARYRNGVADRSELSRQQTSVLNLKNEVPPLEYQARQRLAALRLLTGDYPFTEEIPEAGLLAVQVPEINPETPASLVTRRPDLAAEEARLMAASADVEQARAARINTPQNPSPQKYREIEAATSTTIQRVIAQAMKRMRVRGLSANLQCPLIHIVYMARDYKCRAIIRPVCAAHFDRKAANSHWRAMGIRIKLIHYDSRHVIRHRGIDDAPERHRCIGF